MTTPRFNASILFGHQVVLSNVMGRMQMGQVFSLTPDEYRQLSDLAGALNYWAAQVPQHPTDIQPEIAEGDFSRKLFAASNEVVTAFPFRAPASGYVYMSASEYAGQPWIRRLSISTVAGDMDGPMTVQGKETMAGFTVGTEFAAGTYLYANTLLLDDAPAGTTGSGFSIVWPKT